MGLILVLVVAGVALAFFRDQLDPTVAKLILFVLVVLVLVWLLSILGLADVPTFPLRH